MLFHNLICCFIVVITFLKYLFCRNRSGSCFLKKTFLDKQRVVFAIVSSLLQWNLYVLPWKCAVEMLSVCLSVTL